MEGFRRGERSALEQVYWAYVARVDRLVRRILHLHGRTKLIAAANVEDLVHESFTRAFSPTTRQAYDGIRDYGPYLLTIVRNTVADALRLQQRELLASCAEIESWLALEDATPAEDSLDRIDSLTLARVRDYLSRLPPELQSVHHRRYVLDEGQEAAADALGISRQRIRTLEKKLRLGLARELKKAPAQKISTNIAPSPVLRRT